MRSSVFVAAIGLVLATGAQASPEFLDNLKKGTAEVEAQLEAKAESAMDAIFDKKNELLAEGVTIVGDKVDAADTFKYDKIGEVTGLYYCGPGYCTFPLARRRRALLQQSTRCVECGPDAYCPGGFQSQTEPNRVPCPTPPVGSNIVDFTTDGVTTATSRDQCLVDAAPGYYAIDNVFGPALECGYGFYCPGGVQTTAGAARFPCTDAGTGFTNTSTPTASTAAACNVTYS